MGYFPMHLICCYDWSPGSACTTWITTAHWSFESTCPISNFGSGWLTLLKEKDGTERVLASTVRGLGRPDSIRTTQQNWAGKLGGLHQLHESETEIYILLKYSEISKTHLHECSFRQSDLFI